MDDSMCIDAWWDFCSPSQIGEWCFKSNLRTLPRLPWDVPGIHTGQGILDFISNDVEFRHDFIGNCFIPGHPPPGALTESVGGPVFICRRYGQDLSEVENDDQVTESARDVRWLQKECSRLWIEEERAFDAPLGTALSAAFTPRDEGSPLSWDITTLAAHLVEEFERLLDGDFEIEELLDAVLERLGIENNEEHRVELAAALADHPMIVRDALLPVAINYARNLPGCDPEDLIQEALIRLLKKAPRRVRPSPDSMLPWMRVTIRNVGMTRFNTAQRRRKKLERLHNVFSHRMSDWL
jgi:hypothetical protein